MVKRRTMPGAVKILDIPMNQKEKIEVGISMKVDENLLDRKIENCVFVKTILMLLVILYHYAYFGTEHGSQLYKRKE